MDLAHFFVGKEQDKNLATWMKEKYGLARDKRGFKLASINDKAIRFTARVMSIKFLQNMRPNQCTVRVKLRQSSVLSVFR